MRRRRIAQQEKQERDEEWEAARTSNNPYALAELGYNRLIKYEDDRKYAYEMAVAAVVPDDSSDSSSFDFPDLEDLKQELDDVEPDKRKKFVTDGYPKYEKYFLQLSVADQAAIHGNLDAIRYLVDQKYADPKVVLLSCIKSNEMKLNEFTRAVIQYLVKECKVEINEYDLIEIIEIDEDDEDNQDMSDEEDHNEKATICNEKINKWIKGTHPLYPLCDSSTESTQSTEKVTGKRKREDSGESEGKRKKEE